MKRNADTPLRWTRQSVLVPLPQAPAVYGPSRSWFYRQAAEGSVKLVKIGRGTWVDGASVLRTLAELPILVPQAA